MPEAVLILFKTAIQLEVFRPPLSVSTRNGPRLQDTITTWCINDYFSEKDCNYLNAVSA